MANITFQLTSAINAGFKEGTDKHSYRQQNSTWGKPSGKVFSYSSRKELIQTANNFGKYLKSNCPEVKYAYQITSQNVENWLKTKLGNQQSTVNQYASRMRKIEALCKMQYKTLDNNWNVKTPRCEFQSKLRDVVCKQEHLKEVMDLTKDRECHSRGAVQFSMRFAARVEESSSIKVSEIDLRNKVIHMHSTKGGRARDLPIKDRDVEFLEEKMKGLERNERLFPVKPDSINKWLHDNMLKAGHKEYSEAKTGIHAIRKMVAQERYDECRNSGMTKEQSLGYVNEYLGHSYYRTSLNEVYINNQW